MIYIKIRISLINHEALQINNDTNLNWNNILNFYKLNTNFSQNFLIKFNYNFNNIFPIYYAQCLQNSKFLQNIKFKFFYFLKIFFSFLTTIWCFFFYLNFKERIDGIFGKRTLLLRIIDGKKMAYVDRIKEMNEDIRILQQQGINYLSNAQIFKNFSEDQDFSNLRQHTTLNYLPERIQLLKTHIHFLTDLQNTVQKLPLYFFIFPQNTQKIIHLNNIVDKCFLDPGSDFSEIKNFVKNNLNNDYNEFFLIFIFKKIIKFFNF